MNRFAYSARHHSPWSATVASACGHAHTLWSSKTGFARAVSCRRSSARPIRSTLCRHHRKCRQSFDRHDQEHRAHLPVDLPRYLCEGGLRQTLRIVRTRWSPRTCSTTGCCRSMRRMAYGCSGSSPTVARSTAAIANPMNTNSTWRWRTSIIPAPRPSPPQTNGICERFHRTIQEEFYSVAFRKRLYRSLEELQPPWQTFLDSRHLAQSKMLDDLTATAPSDTARQRAELEPERGHAERRRRRSALERCLRMGFVRSSLSYYRTHHPRRLQSLRPESGQSAASGACPWPPNSRQRAGPAPSCRASLCPESVWHWPAVRCRAIAVPPPLQHSAAFQRASSSTATRRYPDRRPVLRRPVLQALRACPTWIRNCQGERRTTSTGTSAYSARFRVVTATAAANNPREIQLNERITF